MLDITPEDIAALADDDLRILIGMLCEAELRKRGLSESHATWGGHQDAPDGGIDVRVKLEPGTEIGGFIPRPSTGFQVKRPDMSTAPIRNEMRPGGVLRPAIEDLASAQGAYIIVSSGASVSDTALPVRVDAMKACVTDIAAPASLFVDFYDRTRIATWVRANPGLIPWTRAKAGRHIAGWQSYGPWAGSDVSSDFLSDEHSRVFVGHDRDGDGLTTIEGIKKIRAVLSNGGGVVRLVGLSGVGKTRLAQALFDARISDDALDKSLALYTNTSDDPDPVPVTMISDVAAGNTRAIVIVDNCPADLHRRLAETCQGTSVSVITVEYDIREHQPHGTEVFFLEPSSPEMTERVLKSRYPRISQVDRGRIASLAGGNFRVALALAGVVEGGVDASGLTDDELFTRLFYQRNEQDAGLLRAAQACSLLYSFDGEAIGQDSELTRLGTLAGQNAAALHAHVAELRRRDLAQARGIWRAVLPHAIANRLARLALQNTPATMVEAMFGNGAPERVRRSFSRRLGYLHDDATARSLVRRWLASDGPLGHPALFDDTAAQMFKNVAPVAPEAALAALERAVSAGDAKRLAQSGHNFDRLLRSLAYDAALFDRSVNVLIALALAQNAEEKSTAGDTLQSLFFPYLSGTHASVEQRISVMERLVQSANPRERMLGLNALTSLLEASHFTSMYDFEFGMRTRNHGLRPDAAELRAWYAAVLRSAESIAISEKPAAREVSAVIARAFRGLWAHAGMYNDLERVADVITARGYWREGWLATRQTLIYSKSDLTKESKKRLIALEQKLRPINLVQRVQSIVIGPRQGRISVDEYEDDNDDISEGLRRTADLVSRLGVEVANDRGAFDQLLPELFVSNSCIVNFAVGLGSSTDDPVGIWQALKATYAGLDQMHKRAQLLFGFLQGAQKTYPDMVESMLDNAISDTALENIFPFLQCAVPIGSVGAKRLIKGLDLGIAPIQEYRRIAWGRAHESISGADLSAVLTKLGSISEGIGPALEIVFFRFFGEKKGEAEPEIIAAGRHLLSIMTFDRTTDQEDDHLALVVRRCLGDETAAHVARVICESFRKFIVEQHGDFERYDRFFGALCETQPDILLDTLSTGQTNCLTQLARSAGYMERYRANPFASLRPEAMQNWCAKDPQSRAIALAAVVPFVRKDEEGQVSSEWSEHAQVLIELAPDKVEVLKVFCKRFRPSSWSGSRASILQSRMSLLEDLKTHADAAVAAYATTAANQLAREIEQERKWEAEHYHRDEERFE